MHSKWQIWDLFSSFPMGGFSSLQGKAVLQAFDPLALRLMKDHLLEGPGPRPTQITGNEVTLEWAEDQFLSLGLFGNSESFLINRPEEMPAASKEFFLRDDLILDGRCVAFAFHSDSAYAKKLLKAPGMGHVQIEAPRFWETAKLLDFLCGHLKLPLKLEAKQYLLEAVEQEFMDLHDACRLIKLNYPDAPEVKLAQVQELVGQERLDQFALATELGKKSWRAFFDRLLEIEYEPTRLVQVFAFLQGHLLRIADPSYLQGKARLSQYDKEIQTLSKLWRPAEVRQTLRRLQGWEISAKSKDPLLQSELRLARLKVLKGELR